MPTQSLFNSFNRLKRFTGGGEPNTGNGVGDMLTFRNAMDTGREWYSKYGGGGGGNVSGFGAGVGAMGGAGEGGVEGGGTSIRYPDRYGFGYDPENMSRFDLGGFRNAIRRIGPKFLYNIYKVDPEYATQVYDKLYPEGSGIGSWLSSFGYDPNVSGIRGATEPVPEEVPDIYQPAPVPGSSGPFKRTMIPGLRAPAQYGDTNLLNMIQRLLPMVNFQRF